MLPVRHAARPRAGLFFSEAVNLEPPRLLLEEWPPAAAIGVECIRVRSTGQQPLDKQLRVWWARRPLTASRVAVDACRYLGALIVGAVLGTGKDGLLSEVYGPVPGYWGSRPLVDNVKESTL